MVAVPISSQPVPEAEKTRRSIVHPAFAELDLEGCPTAVSRIHDGVHLQAVFLAVVEDLGIGSLRVDAQVSDD